MYACVFHSGTPTKALHVYLFSAVHDLCLLRLILFDLMTRIIFGVGNNPRSYAWLQTSAAK